MMICLVPPVSSRSRIRRSAGGRPGLLGPSETAPAPKPDSRNPAARYPPGPPPTAPTSTGPPAPRPEPSPRAAPSHRASRHPAASSCLSKSSPPSLISPRGRRLASFMAANSKSTSMTRSPSSMRFAGVRSLWQGTNTGPAARAPSVPQSAGAIRGLSLGEPSPALQPPRHRLPAARTSARSRKVGQQHGSRQRRGDRRTTQARAGRPGSAGGRRVAP